ncbi:MAG: NTP transferase domain-containing protein [Candidatus Omnitrophota bacterium]|nr:NTP transferase domain-containing protein [Candidatus Omnitrophota bacterium]
MKSTIAVILAAGRGTRMRSDTPKVLHEILGKPMISYVTGAVSRTGVKDLVVVTGFGSDKIKEFFYCTKVKTVVQKKLLGSADAVAAAKREIGSKSDVLVVYGDTPLITERTLKSLIEKHESSGASLTLLTAVLKDPSGYGRIIRDTAGRITKIAEESELREYKKEIREINVGTCIFKSVDLLAALKNIGCDNSKKEYYLTDAVKILSARAKRIESVAMENLDEMIGVNSRIELAQATGIMKKRVAEELMSSGVTIQDPATTTIYPDVKIGKDTIIYPNTIIESDVIIGENCHIGPFTRLRGGTRIGDKTEVGNFVELVRTRISDSTKVKHHTYLGDATVGRHVNIGAGTITANYDGKNKNKTIIGDGSFIGVGAILIAPVKIGKKALVGAGAVILRKTIVKDGATVVGVPAKVLRRRIGDRRKGDRR